MKRLCAAAIAAGACTSPAPVCTHDQMPTSERLPPDPVAGYHVYGHAHNDYLHAHPLLDALDHHFYSVEADLWYDDGRLSISHDGAPYVGTLAGLYLDPLAAQVAANGGSVYGDGVSFRLVIDIKDDRAELPGALYDLIASYPIVTAAGAPVAIVATGNATMKRALVALAPQLAVRDSNSFSPDDPPADGQWTDYALDWGNYLGWGGDGAIPAGDARQLGCLVDDAHALGRRLRLWDTPDDRAVWQAELDAGVDYINTDDLAGLDEFFSEQ